MKRLIILISIVRLRTNITSVSNVNIASYSKLPPTESIISVTDITPQFCYSKSSIPGTGSGAQTYKTGQHQ